MQETPQYHARRGALYGYASTALQYPDEETLADLTDDEVVQSVRDAADAFGVSEDLAALQEAAAETSQPVLEAMYNELFGIPDGDDGTYPVVPYEAQYTVGSEVNEVQRRIATVVGLLEEFGLQPSDDHHERQDHVTVELELMQVVATQRAVALQEGDAAAADDLASAEATILDEHLTGFVPALSERVDRATDSDLYRAATDFAEALVTDDAAAHGPPSVADGRSTEVSARE